MLHGYGLTRSTMLGMMDGIHDPASSATFSWSCSKHHPPVHPAPSTILPTLRGCSKQDALHHVGVPPGRMHALRSLAVMSPPLGRSVEGRQYGVSSGSMW
jgi:hypothetical protein